jgi:hypothetical protein
MQIQQFFQICRDKKVNFQWDDDDVRYVLDQHT